MNIYIASHYMETGYRVRRSTWNDLSYLQKSYNGVIEINMRCLHPQGPDTYQKMAWAPRCHDLAAQDWELILDDITDDSNYVKYCNIKL